VFFRGAQSDGEVNLVRISIGGNLDCAGGTFTNPGGKAVNADNAEIKGNVFLRDGFNAKSRRDLRRRKLGWFRFGEDVFSDATVGYGIYPGSRAVFVGIDSSGLARALAGTTDEGDGANG